jgi:hypothetical protein
LAREVENIRLIVIYGGVISRGGSCDRRKRTADCDADRASQSDTYFNTDRRRHKGTDGASISR